MRIAPVIALALGLTLGIAEAQQKEEAQPPAIEYGSKVELEYTLTDNDGNDLGSNRGGEPLSFIQGRQEILPGLEKALDGMRVGEEKKVTLKPAEAYGDVNPNAVKEVPKEQFPDETLTAGMDVVTLDESGERRTVRIKVIKDETVILDLNHPLAGKTLVFDVKVLGVEPPAR
jgi:FKBP-type peptidyl-prolyl cis-trans isomerase SlyD